MPEKKPLFILKIGDKVKIKNEKKIGTIKGITNDKTWVGGVGYLVDFGKKDVKWFAGREIFLANQLKLF